jgi:hypothetical protein
MHALSDWQGRICVLNFWSADCPHAERVDAQLLSMLPGWGEAVRLVWIASNANEPPELLQHTAASRNLPLVLFDEGNRVADLYGAATTPHMYVIDAGGILRYQGAFDDVTFRQRTPTRVYLQEAVQVLLAGGLPEPAFTAPYGCAINRLYKA